MIALARRAAAMLNEGNRLRKQVSRIVAAVQRLVIDGKAPKQPKTPKQPKRPKPAPNSGSDASPSPTKPAPKKKPLSAWKQRQVDAKSKKAARSAAIAAWEQTPESKDSTGAARCWLFDQDPDWCKHAVCPHKANGVTRSHLPAA